MLREWKTEWMKTRYRGIGWMILAFSGLVFLWTVWAYGGRMPKEQLEDGFRMCFLQLPLMDTILMPTMIAMLASRLCDAEVKGDTLKLLCTMEKKGRLFDMKLLTGAVYLAVYLALQIGIIFFQAERYNFAEPKHMIQLLYFILQVYSVSLALLLLQVVLSFFFENQILPLAAGVFGSFVGLFSVFFAVGRVIILFWGVYFY